MSTSPPNLPAAPKAVRSRWRWLWLGPLLIWAGPATLLGLTIGLLALPTGTRWRRIGPTLEIYGGLVALFLRWTPVRAVALTLGHVVLGQNADVLDEVREHEWVHVRQYERWGPLFLPAYLGCSLWLWLRGRDCYRENPFEIEAFTADALRAQSRSRQPPAR